jgi:hypothetical protein
LLQDLLARGASANVRTPDGRPMSGDQYAAASDEVRRVLREHAARQGSK